MSHPKALCNLTREEFNTLKSSGLLTRLYSNAPDFFEDIHPVKLEPIINPDFNAVINTAKTIVALKEKDGYDHIDHIHYAYEALMTAIYGEGIWDYFLKLAKNRGLKQ
jgi:hypothetical protein